MSEFNRVFLVLAMVNFYFNQGIHNVRVHGDSLVTQQLFVAHGEPGNEARWGREGGRE